MSELIKLYEDHVDRKKLKHIVEILRNGGLIIYPTDTVYGLGCDITNKSALEKLARIKGVRLDKANFSFICEDLSNLSDHVAQIETQTFKILKRNLPGPYTFILPGSNSLPSVFRKKKTVGIRVPDNQIALALVRELGNPIVSTSIKDDDEILEYTTDPSLMFDEWKHQVDVVIDGGFGGNEASTVIDLTGREPVLIREGKGEVLV
ncbi:MAG TPA: threonylcarbamoyl-AMP synthase [Balneola sp.]|jgi:tRNA threonylcarbamoyl adenosine modification protein (Sua5/YciO/YrdC/YwlC family)|nr:threonylcarbamoyl-AMP synthase [Bacteroidota bacterium]MAC05962.1 threonylcarbamoyl-AMP synthase [Balneola sp.]MAO77761.1 threonylcarbamoyl-AMP synthase [Balneola sp.]MBF63215.1 threonylcarbamoyl-AMP synthase [Balneola sp.]HAH51579.1 threonylcarbamoyl-AMP synthase [Balneola sp.]|tara:strand:- start:21072 stop:21689 length:618 start_codon:yes stop_codon:yes gene_type:complete